MPRILTPAWLLTMIAVLALGAACNGDSGGEATAAPLTSLEELESFRYTLALVLDGGGGGDSSAAPGVSLDLDFNIEASGAVVAPDRQQSQIKADLGFIAIDLETISIGDRSWTRETGGDWSEAGAGDSGLGDFGVPDVNPADLLGGDNEEGLASLRSLLDGRTGVREDINGADAVRYEFTREDFVEVFAEELAGDESIDDLSELTASIWVERETGLLVRMLVEGSGTAEGTDAEFRLEIDLTDLNSDSIEIEPPI